MQALDFGVSRDKRVLMTAAQSCPSGVSMHRSLSCMTKLLLYRFVPIFHDERLASTASTQDKKLLHVAEQFVRVSSSASSTTMLMANAPGMTAGQPPRMQVKSSFSMDSFMIFSAILQYASKGEAGHVQVHRLAPHKYETP